MKSKLKLLVLLGVLAATMPSCKDEEDELTLIEAATIVSKHTPDINLETVRIGANVAELSVGVYRTDTMHTLECSKVGVLCQEVANGSTSYYDLSLDLSGQSSVEDVSKEKGWDLATVVNGQYDKFTIEWLKPNTDYVTRAYAYYRVSPMSDWVLEYSDTVRFTTKGWRYDYESLVYPEEIKVRAVTGTYGLVGYESVDTFVVDYSGVKLVDDDGLDMLDEPHLYFGMGVQFGDNFRNPAEHYSQDYESYSSSVDIDLFNRKYCYIPLQSSVPEVLKFRLHYYFYHNNIETQYFSKVMYIRVVKE